MLGLLQVLNQTLPCLLLPVLAFTELLLVFFFLFFILLLHQHREIDAVYGRETLFFIAFVPE